MNFPPFRTQLSLGRIQSYIGLRMGSHHGGDVGWQSELRLVAMGPELLLQAVGSSLKVSLFSSFGLVWMKKSSRAGLES